MKLTRDDIEDMTAATLRSLRPTPRWQREPHYLGMYGIVNPWTAWIMRQDARLVERTSADLTGWQEPDADR